jgi:signal transduction histidine kinase
MELYVMSGEKRGDQPAASAATTGLVDRLERGPLRALEALKTRIAAVADRGVAALDDLRDIDRLAATALDELDQVILAAPGSAEDPAERRSADFWVRLGELCGGFHSSSGLECRLVIPQGRSHFHAAAAEVLLRVIAELLTNVRKHACANSVEVSSTVRADGSVVVTVKDDGIGLTAPEQIRPLEDGTFGLWSIKQRLQEIGGFMELENDAGLCARVIVPPTARSIGLGVP